MSKEIIKEVEIEDLIRNILKERENVLKNWKRQKLTTGRNVKNFENWFLVEFVHRLFEKYENEVEIRTNGGIIENTRYNNPKNLKKISHRKNKSSGFSPDISFKWKDTVTDIQIKTQFRPQEVKDDIIIVQYWNTKGKINNYNYRAYFILMIIAPPEKEKDFWKRVESNIEKLNKELNVELKPIKKGKRRRLAANLYCQFHLNNLIPFPLF